MTVLDSTTALYAALKFVPEGGRMTVYTRDSRRARTNVVAELRKEPGGGWDDWQVLRRPETADASLLPDTWPEENPAIISCRTLADSLAENPDLWAEVED
ncbi:hypothetical protein [Serinicoccus chungangensis]|uniref:hypothetical protein n=1 Tax=Serinicoccus chungangensis TaxID=767452 RepID=UPI0011189DF9|nr:hypothetical protein [Serinicoccus chungangensis]